MSEDDSGSDGPIDVELRADETVEHETSPSLVGFVFDDTGHQALAMLSLLVLPFLWAKNARYVVTDQRVIKKVSKFGVGEEKTEEIPVDDVVTINSSQMQYESYVDAGNLQLSTEDGELLSLFSFEEFREAGDVVSELSGTEHNRQ